MAIAETSRSNIVFKRMSIRWRGGRIQWTPSLCIRSQGAAQRVLASVVASFKVTIRVIPKCYKRVTLLTLDDNNYI